MSDPASATRRIITLLQVLADHPRRGVWAKDLIAAVGGGYGGTEESQREALKRDLRYLVRVGHDIVNIADEGTDARYLLRPGDDRVRITFSAEQLFELQRAAVLVGVDRLGSTAEGAAPSLAEPIRVPDSLDLVARAVSARAVVRFESGGRPRTVHPYGLVVTPRGWALDGWEAESGRAKTFALSRMASVRIDRPGTAAPPERSDNPTSDPLRYKYDPPTTALLQVVRRFRKQVESVLSGPESAEPGPEVEGEATDVLRYTVVNRRYFLLQVLRLDTRVVLLGGESLREEFREMLRALQEAD